METSFSTSGKLWKWSSTEAMGSWFFVTIEPKLAKKIKAMVDSLPKAKWRAKAMVKVKVRIGWVVRETSLFHTKWWEYLLPIKASIRKELQLKEGDKVTMELEML